MFRSILAFIKKETVLVIAGLLAIVSCFIIHPDAAYAGYINYRVLGLLFCLMTVVAGMKEAGFFDALSRALISRVHTTRQISLLLVFLSFVLSMFLTNDVTLVTVVPFTMLVFAGIQDSADDLLFTLIFETVAANLGSMLTPFGNPQNLYLYSAYDFSMNEFIGIMLPYTLLSIALIAVFTALFCGRRKPRREKHGMHGEDGVLSPEATGNARADRVTRSSVHAGDVMPLRTGSFVFYLIFFLAALLAVARVLDYRILLAVTIAAVLIKDRKILLRVDYSLLVTFIFFFVFIGNIGRADAVQNFLRSIMEGRETLTAILASQVVSNVPAALLLSGFTKNGAALVIGTNLGGLGTLIASMASLITYKLFAEQNAESRGRYLLHFTWINVLFLGLLYGFYLLIR
ncbi:MAG: SLC13 family permease [Eubacterium sp.]|nr:SLC13 family permease [Eubacterium sp.]